MVIRRSVFLAGRTPPTFAAGSVGDCLNLIELQLDGGFAAEHGDGHADFVLFDVEHLDKAVESGQRAIRNADGIADLIADDDLALFNAKLIDFIFRQGRALYRN